MNGHSDLLEPPTVEEPLGGNLPEVDFSNPAEVEAFYGNYSFFDHYRKSVLADCREIIRAQYTLRNEKVTETRLDDLARLHPNYLDFLATHLQGRVQREANIRESLRNGA